MNRILKVLSILIAACTIQACNTANDQAQQDTKQIVTAGQGSGSIAQAGWLLGNWEHVTEAGRTVEVWGKADDTTYSGFSYLIKGADTMFSETISLEQRGNELRYIPIVKDQNEGAPVVFRMTSISDKVMVFENAAHDFPQKIAYIKVTNDSVVAEISGMMKGQQYAEQFPLARTK